MATPSTVFADTLHTTPPGTWTESEIVAWYAMDEAEGTTLFDRMQNADGLIVNDPDAIFNEPPLLAQSHGTSITFAGEAYVELGTGPFDYIHETADFTIAGFVMPEQLATQMAVVTSSQASAHKGFRIDIFNGKFRGILTTGSTKRILTGTSTLSVNTPHMFAFVGDGTNLSLYVDGILEATTSAVTGSGGATFPVRVGRFPTSLCTLS